MEIGSRIRAARKAAGLSQEELARRAGMSLKGMSYIERGHIEDPHYSSLSKIADGLGVSLGELLGEAAAPNLDLTPVGKEVRLQWNVAEPVGKSLTLSWNVEAVAREVTELVIERSRRGADTFNIQSEVAEI